MNVATITEWVNKTLLHVKRRLGMNAPGWDGPPVDEGHATYRRQYEALLPTLPHLPRGVHHENAFERRNAILYLAELLDGLHNYGDDPIMPPGVRRIVVRETQRMAALGDVGEPKRFLGPLAASPALAILASPWTWLVAALALTGLQTARLNHAKGNLEEARADLAQMEVSRDAYARTLGAERASHARDVAQVLEQTADTVEQMRVQAARRAAREARERSRREDLARGNVNFTERLRELAQPDPGLPADPAATPGGGPAGAVSTEPRSDADNGAHP